MKQTKTSTEATNRKLIGLTSLNQTEYARLLGHFSELVEKKLQLYTLKGAKRVSRCHKEPRNSSLYGSDKKLSFILMYMKENPNQLYHGQSFGIGQSKASEWVSFLSPVLEESLRKMGFMPQTGYRYVYQESGSGYLAMDVTEREVTRDVDHGNQKEEYSGKKKLHTIKNLAITTPKSYILYLSPSCQGSTHDKAIWDTLDISGGPCNLLADLGFLGIEKEYPNAILPYKKPKNGELTKLQKQINKGISKARVTVEHAFAGVKRLKIIRNKIRLKTSQVRDRLMAIACALHNLRIDSRIP